jgi:sulfite exporter TauE/SafE
VFKVIFVQGKGKCSSSCGGVNNTESVMKKKNENSSEYFGIVLNSTHLAVRAAVMAGANPQRIIGSMLEI